MNGTRGVVWMMTSFDGRTGRRDYWVRGILPIFIFTLIAGVILGTSGFSQEQVSGLTSLIFLIPNLAVGAKRCHDRDRTGWFMLIGLIPIIGWLWLLVELGFLRGTVGGNRFGPDPLAEAAA